MVLRRSVLVLAAAASLATAARADAFVTTGQRWPGPKIGYHVATPSLRAPVRSAVAQWNRLGLGAAFVAVPANEADVDLRAQRDFPCGGVGTLGYTPGAARVRIGRCRTRSALVLVATHELGHVLGLGHERRRCALMNAMAIGLRPARCRRALNPRRAILADDRAGARALYGEPFDLAGPGR